MIRLFLMIYLYKNTFNRIECTTTTKSFNNNDLKPDFNLLMDVRDIHHQFNFDLFYWMICHPRAITHCFVLGVESWMQVRLKMPIKFRFPLNIIYLFIYVFQFFKRNIVSNCNKPAHGDTISIYTVFLQLFFFLIEFFIETSIHSTENFDSSR